jgi:hypothetical protein
MSIYREDDIKYGKHIVHVRSAGIVSIRASTILDWATPTWSPTDSFESDQTSRVVFLSAAPRSEGLNFHPSYVMAHLFKHVDLWAVSSVTYPNKIPAWDKAI